MAKFRARARTVDMLGRQQIAGAATAISELFKNAHDAFATRVEVDYYRPENLFLLRDNGIGMTLDEFQERWLTLGTESKVEGASPPYRPPGAKPRPVMGEKGIGRLAIARIGPQVLVLTRARREKTLHDLVVGLVNWELFELPGINLDEIEIPVVTCAAGMLPTAADIKRLTHEVQAVVESLRGRVPENRLATISRNLSKFAADPRQVDVFFNQGDAAVLNQPALSLQGEGSGTHFLIQPADSFLGEEIARDQREEAEPTFAKFLVGFANTMVPGAAPPPVRTRFRDWRFPESATELIGGGAFITPEDFANADHHFSGRFDEFGQFEGEVRIYNAPPVRHVIPWEGASGVQTMCGPFSINLAYLQGAARESHLTPQEHAVLYRKLTRFGGLYVYKDGIRVLPYGNSDFDWLNIETRRNKGSGYYFFAYRRMFGAVEISQTANSSLVEKAGREGFQLNRAYRQFTEILENFFIQLAADFFRDSGVKAAVFSERKAELERAELARRKREESVASRRKAFSGSLEAFFKSTEQEQPQQALSQLFSEVHSALSAARAESDNDRAAALLIEAEAYAEHKLAEVRQQSSVARPRDIGLSAALRREWESYLAERERLESEVFKPASEKLRDTIGAAAAAARIQIDQRKRLQTLISELAEEIQKSVQTCAREACVSAEQKQDEVRQLAHGAIVDIRDVVDAVKADLQKVDLSKLHPNEIEELRADLQGRLDDAANRHIASLSNARQQLLEVSVAGNTGDSPLVSSGEITGAIEEEVLALREAADANAELIQLGMALSVVTHEFDAVIRAIREQLKRLKGWATASPQLRPIYERISGNFEHLDGYLALFTPLQRRLYREPQRIPGSEIAKFLEELFSERFKRHKISLKVSSAFTKYVITGFPSTFYPVFVNIVDNAIYWLTDHQGERAVMLDADQDGLSIANTGPRIAARDKEAVFDLRFTRKPGGRGLGLYISRQTLAKAGYRLFLATSDQAPVCFRVAPATEKTSEDNNGQE